MYYLDYYVDHENDTVPVGSFCADKCTVDRNSDKDNDTSGFVILHVGDEDMVFIADKIHGIECLKEDDED